jgi:ABC-2 type transport system ATP-binding protein
MDIEARQALWRAIGQLAAQGCSVLLTTHYLEEAEALADRVVVLARGRVVAAGSMEEVRRHVAQRRIRCVCALDVARIAAWPEVRSARTVGEAVAGAETAGEAVAGETAAAETPAGAAMAAMPSAAAEDRGHGRAHAGHRIEIITDAAETVVRRLLAADAALSELEVQRAGLAEAFLELTRDPGAGAAPPSQSEAA